MWDLIRDKNFLLSQAVGCRSKRKKSSASWRIVLPACRQEGIYFRTFYIKTKKYKASNIDVICY